MSDSTFSWIPSYEAIATALLDYQDRQEVLCEVVHDVIGERHEAMDPLTFFSMFNGKRRNRERRIEAVKKVLGTLGIDEQAPTDFDGIPLTNPQRWRFWDGRPSTIKHNWELFRAALTFADSKGEQGREGLVRLFDVVHAQGNIGDAWTTSKSLTMALFWARPRVFLPLDNNTKTYLGSRLGTRVPAPISGKEYLSLLEEVRGVTSDDFPAISHASWADPFDAGGALGDADVDSVRYWLFAPGRRASLWDEYYERGLMGIGWHALGDLTTYASKAAVRSRLQEIDGSESHYFNAVQITWQFVHDVKPGDIVFAKRGHSEIIGRGTVVGDYEYDERAGRYPNLREVRWTHKGSWVIDRNLAIKTLTEVTDYTDLVTTLSALFVDADDGDEEEEPVADRPSYGRDEFLSQAYMSAAQYDTLVGVLRSKKNGSVQHAALRADR